MLRGRFVVLFVRKLVQGNLLWLHREDRNQGTVHLVLPGLLTILSTLLRCKCLMGDILGISCQMNPQNSTHSSPKERLSFSPSFPSALPIIELPNIRSSKSELRDVPVDERVTMTRWSKKHRVRNIRKNSEIADDWTKKAVDTCTSTWDVTETGKSISKIKREEAKITAWENLQKAKAEAAIRKLEMKLEKKRSSSMDKIMNKLRSAQKKAQEMRSSMLGNQAHQAKTSYMSLSFRRTRQMGSLSGCFTCHAF